MHRSTDTGTPAMTAAATGWRRAAAAVLAALLAGCGAKVQEIGPEIVTPRLLPDGVVTPDGAVLPARAWLPDEGYDRPQAVILALHGFNDYSRAFEHPAPALTAAGMLVYAYDQRGFGATREPGVWAGGEVLVADARRAIAMVREAYPDVPLYVMGESMGGAVATAAVATSDTPVDGLILLAPAYWGWRSLGAIESFTLELMTFLTPWLPLTGEGLQITPTDNLEILRQMARDPLVIKETRVDGIFGLVGLMDSGFEALDDLDVPVLMLYGGKEDLLPEAAVEAAVAQLERCRGCAPRVAFYENGYHMLLRDLNGPVVIGDIVGWIADPARPLASGAGRATPSVAATGGR